MLRMIGTIANALAAITSFLSRLMLLAVAIMLFVQVVLRFVFSYSLPWPEEASRYLMIWIVMLAGSLLVKDEQLVSVDFFDRFWPKNIIAYRNALFRLFLVGLLATLFWEGLGEAEFSYMRTTTALQISWFWVLLAIPVGSALMLLQMVVLIVRDLAVGAPDHKDAVVLPADA
jgi:TRAP-type C4-dicarboxylate transport system permease small subunit